MNKRIKVLSVIDGLGFAGDESRLLSFSRTLDSHRFSHSVLTLNPAAYSSVEQFAARRAQFVNAGVVVQDLSDVSPQSFAGSRHLPRFLYNKTGILRRTVQLANIVRKWKVDVLDGHLDAAGLIGVLAGRLTGTPSSITLYCGNKVGDRVIWPRPTRLAMRLVNAVLTDSDIRANEMKALIPKQPAKVCVIPNGIPKPHSNRTTSEMRRLLGLPMDLTVPIIGMVARFVEYKGHRVLLEAMAKVLRQQPKTALLATGFTPSESYRDSLKQLSRDLSIADRVVLTEYPGDIADVWNVIDIHAHASLFDSLPISIAEGMSLAKPAVVTSAGGIPEIVLHGTTGLIVPPADADAFAAALIELLTKPDLARTLGGNARARYEALYQPEVMTRAMENYFADIVIRSRMKSGKPVD